MSTGHNYDYWVLTKVGDFYSLGSLFEDTREEGVLFFNTRIIRATEVIMHCRNLYKGLGVEPGARVTLTLRHGGLKGRILSATGNRHMFPDRRSTHEDEVTTTVTFDVGVGEAEIVSLVKNLCEPLFMVFDFEHFTDSIYEQIVTNYLQGKAT
jgi:hypothetical protein